MGDQQRWLRFRIDRPQDPANKYLVHTCVESPDMLTVYDGVATLDARGEAAVELPGYFAALNGDVRYQRTALGGAAPSQHVAQELQGNRFRVAGGAPGQRVCWLVTGVRRDACALAHRGPAEEPKPAAERGRYLHPEAHGRPKEQGVDYERRRLAEAERESPPARVPATAPLIDP